MLLLREGLPGWLARQEQLLAQEFGPANSPASAASEAAPREDHPIVSTVPSDIPLPLLADLIRAISNLIVPSTQQVQHES